jgi:hypothetical protein
LLTGFIKYRLLPFASLRIWWTAARDCTSCTSGAGYPKIQLSCHMQLVMDSHQSHTPGVADKLIAVLYFARSLKIDLKSFAIRPVRQQLPRLPIVCRGDQVGAAEPELDILILDNSDQVSHVQCSSTGSIGHAQRVVGTQCLREASPRWYPKGLKVCANDLMSCVIKCSCYPQPSGRSHTSDQYRLRPEAW